MFVSVYTVSFIIRVRETMLHIYPTVRCHILEDNSIHNHRHENINPLNAELNLICYLLALLGAHHFLHVSRIRVKSLTLGY